MQFVWYREARVMGAMPLAFALPTKWLFYTDDAEVGESQLCTRI